MASYGECILTREQCEEMKEKYFTWKEELDILMTRRNQIMEYKHLMNKIYEIDSIECVNIDYFADDAKQTVQVLLSDESWEQIKQIILNDYLQKRREAK